MPVATEYSFGPDASSNVFDWRGLVRAFLFFWYFSAICQGILLAINATGFVPFRQGFTLSLLWLIPLLLFPRRARPISALIGIVLWLCSLVSLGYLAIYGQEFSQSVLFIAFESNPAESAEYLGQYFRWWMVPAALVYSAGAYWLWRGIRPLRMKPLGRGLIIALIVGVLFISPATKVMRKGFTIEKMKEAMVTRMEPVIPWQFLIAYAHYESQLAEMQAMIERSRNIPPIAGLRDAHAGEARTLVLVIGESTSRLHMSLYGYGRDTSPKLTAMRDKLTVFDNIYSPRPYTIETLQQVLTFADQENPNLYLTRPSLMSIMQQAGYRTYWITNQQTLTQRNTMLTSFSEQMDEQIYLNHSRSQNAYSFDGVVLEPFQRILEDGHPRRFIVVHLLGTHMRYQFRYPPEYDVFTGRTGLPDWATDAHAPAINEYDNAVRYNDFVVSSLIEKLAAANGGGDAKSMLVYFSDHGEDVYDGPGHDFDGRNEAKPTVPMYAVPFLLWQSDAWHAGEPRRFERYTGRNYQTSHFIHTWADLAGLSFDDFDPSKSVVNDAFRERPILVGDPEDPETLSDLLKPGQSPTKQASGKKKK